MLGHRKGPDPLAGTTSGFPQPWPQIVEAIANRTFEPDEPLDLLIDGANLPLDDDTDDEAYVWFDKMVNNLTRTDGIIDEY